MDIKKISFAISLMGIVTLLFLSIILPVKEVKIGEINKNMMNKKIQVSGEIFNIREYDNFQVISIKDETGKIDITLDKIVELTNGQKIIVIGRIGEFNGFLQVREELEVCRLLQEI